MFIAPYPYLLLDNVPDGTAILLHADDHTEVSQFTESASSEWRAIGRKLGFIFDELESIVHEPGRHGDVDYYQASLKALRLPLSCKQPHYVHPIYCQFKYMAIMYT